MLNITLTKDFTKANTLPTNLKKKFNPKGNSTLYMTGYKTLLDGKESPSIFFVVDSEEYGSEGDDSLDYHTTGYYTGGSLIQVTSKGLILLACYGVLEPADCEGDSNPVYNWSPDQLLYEALFAKEEI